MQTVLDKLMGNKVSLIPPYFKHNFTSLKKGFLFSLLIFLALLFASCTTEVDPIAVSAVTLDKQMLTFTVGGPAQTLTATIAPADADDKTVAWTSSAPAVATVANGVVTPVAAGTATITVTTTDGSKTATCAVTVTTEGSTFTLSFDAGYIVEGSNKTINQGDTAGVLPVPEKSGFTFGGWYKDKGAYTQPFSPDEAINSDSTVYAKWTWINNYDGQVHQNTGPFTESDTIMAANNYRTTDRSFNLELGSIEAGKATLALPANIPDDTLADMDGHLIGVYSMKLASKEGIDGFFSLVQYNGAPGAYGLVLYYAKEKCTINENDEAYDLDAGWNFYKSYFRSGNPPRDIRLDSLEDAYAQGFKWIIGSAMNW